MTGRILVVDDERGIRGFVSEALANVGHEVDQAEDGTVALEKVEARAYDVVITDLKMPKLDGMAVLARVREEQPEVEVIVLTAHGTVDTAVEAMKLGAFDYIQKPIESLSELRVVVERALERKRLRNLADGARRTSYDATTPLTYGAPSMRPVVDALDKVATTDATVLLTGESGTGKEVAARHIHAASERASGPFMAVNCATLSAQLLESELFGHERGAFTGAVERKRGRIELAAGGTFFLDEVGELPVDVQAKLLRVLEERTFERVGGAQQITADVRWVAATNRDLEARIGEGLFREDLYHRLAVFPVALPPLRERRPDIVPLARALLATVAPGRTLTPDAEATLEGGDWPGNVRELRNALERASILAGTETIGAEHLSLRASSTSRRADDRTLAEIERAAIERALELEDGNRERAAKRLQIGVRTLYTKLKQFD